MVFRRNLFCFFLLSLTLGFPIPAFSSDPLPEDTLVAGTPSILELIAEEKAIKRKLGEDPGDPALYFELSNVYASLFDITRKKKPESLKWLLKSGNALEKVILIDPGHKVARFNLGIVYKRQGEMERAREEFKRVIRFSDPATDSRLISACWIQIGMIYSEQGFYDEAKDAFEKALEFDYANHDIRDAIEEVKAAKLSGNFTEQSGIFSEQTMMRTRSSHDPYANEGWGTQPDSFGGVAQALPYLGQLLAQKFTQGGDDDLL